MTKRAFITREEAVAGHATLDAAETRHLCRVLRAREGDVVELLDGVGGRYAGRILEIGKDFCEVEILDEIPAGEKPPFNLTMGISFPDKKRTSGMIRMLSELGVQRVFHLASERAEWNIDAAAGQIPRLEQIARESCKQSGRAVPMQISPPRTFQEICSEIGFRPSVQAMIASTRERRLRVQDRIKLMPPDQKKILILIGPVGDFTEQEYSMANEYGFDPVTLGPNILRVETAAVVAAALALV